jgi:hypothetical protein
LTPTFSSISPRRLFLKEMKRTAKGVLFMLAHEVEAEGPEPWFDQLSDNRTGLTNHEELSALRADLARIEKGWTPSARDLALGPRLDRWGVTQIQGEPLWRLYGKIRRFPGRHCTGNFVSTQVLAVDLNFAWARDRACLYALGAQDPGYRAHR